MAPRCCALVRKLNHLSRTTPATPPTMSGRLQQLETRFTEMEHQLDYTVQRIHRHDTILRTRFPDFGFDLQLFPSAPSAPAPLAPQPSITPATPPTMSNWIRQLESRFTKIAHQMEHQMNHMVQMVHLQDTMLRIGFQDLGFDLQLLPPALPAPSSVASQPTRTPAAPQTMSTRIRQLEARFNKMEHQMLHRLKHMEHMIHLQEIMLLIGFEALGFDTELLSPAPAPPAPLAPAMLMEDEYEEEYDDEDIVA